MKNKFFKILKILNNIVLKMKYLKIVDFYKFTMKIDSDNFYTQNLISNFRELKYIDDKSRSNNKLNRELQNMKKNILEIQVGEISGNIYLFLFY